MIKLIQIFILAQMVIEPQHIPIERGNKNFLIADAIHADPFQESLHLLGGCGKFQCFTHKLALAVLSGVGNVGFKQGRHQRRPCPLTVRMPSRVVAVIPSRWATAISFFMASVILCPQTTST